jgi:hypothetical protein
MDASSWSRLAKSSVGSPWSIMEALFWNIEDSDNVRHSSNHETIEACLSAGTDMG